MNVRATKMAIGVLVTCLLATARADDPKPADVGDLIKKRSEWSVKIAAAQLTADNANTRAARLDLADVKKAAEDDLGKAWPAGTVVQGTGEVEQVMGGGDNFQIKIVWRHDPKDDHKDDRIVLSAKKADWPTVPARHDKIKFQGELRYAGSELLHPGTGDLLVLTKSVLLP